MNKRNPYESPQNPEQLTTKRIRKEPEPLRVGNPGRVAAYASSGGILGAFIGRLIVGRPWTASPLLWSIVGVIIATLVYAIRSSGSLDSEPTLPGAPSGHQDS